MRAITCGALMALAITTASAQQTLFSANSVLPGCKAVFEEGRGRFIEAHPQRMDDAFVGLAFEALLEAWPCRKGQ
jgi:hypothetical protein